MVLFFEILFQKNGQAKSQNVKCDLKQKRDCSFSYQARPENNLGTSNSGIVFRFQKRSIKKVEKQMQN